MNDKMINVVMFIAGAAIGSVVTIKMLEDKYKQIAQEEIDSVKEVYSRRVIDCEDDMEYEEFEDDEDIAPTPSYVKPDLASYTSMLQKEGYVDYTKKQEVNEGTKNMEKDGPRIISPEEFGEHEDYVIYSLTYYADGVLTDEADEPIDDVEDLIGPDALDSFGQYEDDSVFVRDDDIQVDYEILRDTRYYSDVHPSMEG